MDTADSLVGYSLDDIEGARRRRTTFLIWYILMSVAVAAAVTVTALMRQQILTMALTIVGGGAMICVWDVAGAPVMRYMRFLRDHRRGLTHTYTGAFVSWGDIDMRDGVPCRQLMLDIEGETLQFFLDIKKERPAVEPGRTVEVVTHNKAVISMR